MNAESLLTIAEIAAGFIGFSAVATIFVRDTSPLSDFSFQLLVVYCVITLWCCFVPIWLLEVYKGEDIWQVSTFVALGIGSLSAPWIIIQSNRVGTDGPWLSGVGTAGKISQVLQLVQVGVFTALAFQWPMKATQFMYEIALCLWLTMAAFLFIDHIQHLKNRETARGA